MQVQVQMSVHVVQWQAGFAKLCKLRLDLRQQLRFQSAVRKIAHADRHRIEAELPLFIHQVRDFFCGKRRVAVQQRQVQPDSQRWILPRQLDGFRKPWFVQHQAGARENAILMRADDRFVDARRTPKIICVDDQPAS